MNPNAGCHLPLNEKFQKSGLRWFWKRSWWILKPCQMETEPFPDISRCLTYARPDGICQTAGQFHHRLCYPGGMNEINGISDSLDESLKSINLVLGVLDFNQLSYLIQEPFSTKTQENWAWAPPKTLFLSADLTFFGWYISTWKEKWTIDGIDFSKSSGIIHHLTP